MLLTGANRVFTPFPVILQYGQTVSPSFVTSVALSTPGPRPGYVWEVDGISIVLHAVNDRGTGVSADPLTPGQLDHTIYLTEDALTSMAIPVEVPTVAIPGVPPNGVGDTPLLQAVSSLVLYPGQFIKGVLRPSPKFGDAPAPNYDPATNLYRLYAVYSWQINVFGSISRLTGRRLPT